MQRLSRGKFDRLPRTTAGFTTSAFDGYGLRRRLSLRPAPQASNPVLVHRLACLLRASFRPRLATQPLRFAITSRPSRCEEDLHLQAIEHARHTNKRAQPGRAHVFRLLLSALSSPATRCLSHPANPTFDSGISRYRLPVAAKIALYKAGANGGNPGSPAPAGGASLATICTLVSCGATFIRAT